MIKTTKIFFTLSILLSFTWVGISNADDHSRDPKENNKNATHHPTDGHKHKKKRKKSKKTQHKNHKHEAHSPEDEEHHDGEDSHDHNEHEHKKKTKKKKAKKKHEKEHRGDGDHDHQHDEEENHNDHSKDGDGHEGHADHNEHSDHDDHGDEGFGEGKAIVDVKNEGESFKLADEAISLLGLEYGTIKKSVIKNVFIVPTKAIIYFNDEKGIFVKNSGWFKLVDVKLIKRNSNWSQVKSNSLSLGEKIVVSGTGLLRVAHLQASGQGGQGHAH